MWAFYIITIGQRKGLNIDHEKGPWFVVGKDVVKNILYVCRTDQRDLLYSDSCIVKGINWILPSLDEIPTKCTCKFRYRQKDQDIEIERLDDTSVIHKRLRLLQKDRKLYSTMVTSALVGVSLKKSSRMA